MTKRSVAIRVERTESAIKVYISDLLHAWIPLDELVAVQTYRFRRTWNVLFIVRSGGNVHCEYDSLAKFTSVVQQLDALL